MQRSDRLTTATATAAGTAGAEGNALLTSTTGALLVGLLAVEGFTILGIEQMITLHVFLGIALIGPVLLKIVTTTYRFVRYYTGHPAYVRRGAPPALLRLIGPLVVLSSVLVLGTGAALLAFRPGHAGLMLTAHKASFVIWFGLMAVHVLGHAREAARLSWRELRAAHGRAVLSAGAGRTGRSRLRLVALVLALAVGVGAAAVVLPTAAPWTSGRAQLGDH
jgi:hypothetical protein